MEAHTLLINQVLLGASKPRPGEFALPRGNLGRPRLAAPALTSTSEAGTSATTSGTFANGGAAFKMHRCPICSYTTTDVSHLNYHMRAHMGDKPHSCPHCPYRAAKKTHLQNHILIHTGEEPFACALCPYRSKQKGNLKRHVLTNHTIGKK
nr:zinc finger protein 513-like [Penaeus vannamei]